MLYKKEFWFAIFCFVLTIAVVIEWINKGFASYRITGTFIFTLIGIAFLRKALKG